MLNTFRSLQTYLIGFRSELWLQVGLSAVTAVLRVIILLGGEPSAQSQLLKGPDWWRAAAMGHLRDKKSPICSQHVSCHNPADLTAWFVCISWENLDTQIKSDQVTYKRWILIKV